MQLPSISQQPSSSSSSSQQHTSPNVSINTALLNEADDDYEPVQYYPPPSLYQSQFFQLPQTTNLYATQYSQPTHPQQPSRTLSPAEIQLAKNKSCSRRNFAARLVCELFTIEERKTCNVRGVLGKDQLDPSVVEYIKMLAYRYYPLHKGGQAQFME